MFGMEELDMDELTEAQQRYDKRLANKMREASKKKKIMVNLQREVKSIQNAISLMKIYSPKKLIVAQLKCLCRWKKTKGDKPLLTKKADLIAVYRATVGNPSPQVSPCNLEVDESFDYVDSLDSNATWPKKDDLKFGGDSDGEADDDGNRSKEEEEVEED